MADERKWRYHPTLAPQGRLFQTAAEIAALDAAWVDTPAKFPPKGSPRRAPEPDEPDEPKPFARWRKR